MARKSKYILESDPSLSGKSMKWKTALYIRLSREDGDKDESDSVVNQRTLLSDYIQNEPEIDVYDIYVDDGWSGTNFDRPDFQRMMKDIKNQLVNCVVVKDLSRFGRNYIEVGNYIEKVFPFMDIRFISINDSLDSFKNPQSMNTLIVPFKNIINDEYCRDISNKIRSSLDLKRRQGKFIGSFAAYGYLKDPLDHNKLIADEYAAGVVRDIFKWFLQGMGVISIAKRLNSQGVLNPTAYKQSIGLNYRHSTGVKNDKRWCDSTVKRILTNKIYIGTLLQGKNKVKSYKIQVCTAQPEDKWFQKENAHEAIIDKADFMKAQELFSRDSRTSPNEQRLYLFSGFLRCYDCGRGMNRKLISQPYANYVYFVCYTFKKADKNACTKHTIRSDRLEEAVFITIKQQIQLAVSMDEVIKSINEKETVNTESKRLDKHLADKEAEIEKISKLKLGLYPDWKNGDITREEYLTLKEQFDARLEQLTETAGNIKKEIADFKNGVNGGNLFIGNFSKYKETDTLTRDILIELVDYIYVHEGGGITIQFKYEDEFEKAVEFIQNNQKKSKSINILCGGEQNIKINASV